MNQILRSNLAKVYTILNKLMKSKFVFLLECPPGSFRSKEVSKCTKCPSNSSSSNPASEFCKCDTNFYRNNSEKHQPCLQPPGSPKNLTVLFVDHSTVILSWDPPIINQNILYSIKCNVCPINSVFQPSANIFNETKITITNLEANSLYIVQVYSHSKEDIIGNYSEISFTTEYTISTEILKVYIEKVFENEIYLKWDKPLSSIEFYEVKWFIKGGDIFDMNKTSSLRTKELETVIENLLENTEYGFQVRWKTTNGYGPYSNIIYATTQSGIHTGMN